jgi:hypothetical protein
VVRYPDQAQVTLRSLAHSAWAFLLPIRLENCDVPDIRIDEMTSLQSIQMGRSVRSDERSFSRFTNGV